MRLFFKKIFNKSTLKLLFCCLIILFLICSPTYIFNKNNYTMNINKYLTTKNKKQAVLTIWHIESFEGGTKSRKSYLEEIGIKFNKINPNIYFSIMSLTEEQLFLNLQNNKICDIFSFSVGSGCLLTSYLLGLQNNKSINNNLQNYAKVNNEILAYPYMLSSYVAISKNTDESKPLVEKFSLTSNKNVYGFGFDVGGNINVAQCLLNNGINNLNKMQFYSCNSSYDAYTNFINSKFTTLVGTMRDYYRCKNREELGKINSCAYFSLGNYTDLIQYIGINKNLDEGKISIAGAFLNYLLSYSSQSILKKYGLFPSTNITIYEEPFLKEVENKLNKNIKSVNVFSLVSEIEQSKKLSLEELLQN